MSIRYMNGFLNSLIMIMLSCSSTHSQSYPSLSMEGGSGFIYTKMATTYTKGFVGISCYGTFSSVQLPESSKREHLFSSVSAFTYSATDKLEFSMVFYAIGRGIIQDESISDTRIESGLGESLFALKYAIPFRMESMELAGRVAFHVPMGLNFASSPSYPFDTDVYSMEIMTLQTFHVVDKLQLHLNEGYRWRGLRPDYVDETNLILVNLCGSYQWHSKWLGFIGLSSIIEVDENIQPIQDRLVLTQGIQYRIASGFTLNLAGSIRLNQARTDRTANRARNWRFFCGVAIGLQPSIKPFINHTS